VVGQKETITMTRRIFTIVAILFFAGTVLGTIVYPPAKYGVETTIYFSVYDSNSPWQFYETAPAADDVSVRKDGGARARATNAITDLDHVMKLVLTATEMQAAVVTVDVNDESVPALYGSDTIIIPTYGHESAWTIKDSNAIEDLIDPNGLFKVVVHDVSAEAPLATTDDLFDPNATPVQVSTVAVAAIAAAVPSSAFDPNTTPVQVSSTAVDAIATGVGSSDFDPNSTPVQVSTTGTAAISTAVMASVIDGTIDLTEAIQIMLTRMIGKVTVTDNGTTRTMTWYLSNGTTAKLELTAA
jgi:hypothetical protein